MATTTELARTSDETTSPVRRFSPDLLVGAGLLAVVVVGHAAWALLIGVLSGA